MDDFKLKDNIDFLVIIGPTAVGKTDFSIEVAKKYNGEIINGDSVQVYKGLDIGSAKIMPEQMQGIKHHLIDIKEADQMYTLADFQKDCEQKIKEIKSKSHLPIIVGGTGLYINSIVYDYTQTKKEEDLALKEELSSYANEKLYDIVKEKCEKNNVEIHVNNRRRLLSYAYKVIKQIPFKEDLQMKNCQVVCLNMDREKLYQRINLRVDMMFEQGLIDEVKQFDKSWHSQTSIGYKEVHEYLQGNITLEEAIDKVKQNTRNFAKKQMTWFKNKIDAQYIIKD